MNSEGPFLLFYMQFLHTHHIFKIQPLLFLSQPILLERGNPLTFHSIKYSEINTKVREHFTIWLRASRRHVHSGRVRSCLAWLTCCADHPGLSHILCNRDYVQPGRYKCAYMLGGIVGKADVKPLGIFMEYVYSLKLFLQSCHLIIFAKFWENKE